MSLQENAKRLLPLVQAMVDGKTVQVILNGVWTDKETATFDSKHQHRIKPEKKLRPYTREEWEQVHRVRKVVCDSRFSLLVTDIAADSVRLEGVWYPFSRAMDLFTNLDGSPCGVEVEE